MRANPYLNALIASSYIWGIGLLLSHIARLHHDTPDTTMGSVTAISLVVCSVALMAFLFFYRPVALLIQGKQLEAAAFFLKTLGTFAALTTIGVLFLI